MPSTASTSRGAVHHRQTQLDFTRPSRRGRGSTCDVGVFVGERRASLARWDTALALELVLVQDALTVLVRGESNGLARSLSTRVVLPWSTWAMMAMCAVGGPSCLREKAGNYSMAGELDDCLIQLLCTGSMQSGGGHPWRPKKFRRICGLRARPAVHAMRGSRNTHKARRPLVPFARRPHRHARPDTSAASCPSLKHRCSSTTPAEQGHDRGAQSRAGEADGYMTATAHRHVDAPASIAACFHPLTDFEYTGRSRT